MLEKDFHEVDVVMKKTTIALLAACFFVGLVFGVVLCQPEINRQREDISVARAQMGDLQTQVNELESSRSYLISQAEIMQVDLESAIAELQGANERLEFLENALDYLGAYVVKDVDFLSLLLERLEYYPFSDLALLEELKGASYDVNPSTASSISAIMDDIVTLSDWSTRMPLEDAPCDERYMWLMEGYQTIGRYLIDYREFVQSFLEPVETHLEAVKELSSAD